MGLGDIKRHSAKANEDELLKSLRDVVAFIAAKTKAPLRRTG